MSILAFSLKIEEERYVPYPFAKKILQQIVSSGNSSAVIQRTFEYLNTFSKCDDSEAEAVMEELKEIIPREDVRAIIASLCPTTIEEVRSILVLDSGKTYTTEQIQKVIEIVKSHLKS